MFDRNTGIHTTKAAGGKWDRVLVSDERRPEKGPDKNRRIGRGMRDADLKKLNQNAPLDDWAGELLDGAVFFFIRELDQAVAQELAARGLPAPQNCYGSHYGLSRHHYYFDEKLLDRPEEFREHLFHEMQERADVLRDLRGRRGRR